eukprot:CAMPEP_0198236302 /NCGR_PEP_ID=MMETSP1446-20131203/2196_1 /TAXON_ID=1461542 ORGANISM="Unidentified sp, Strain CCMP2111" /NCGR_SAMPLE_ID=MMETSP1446 /ASSEMBLY_ACC=CAM_ASM_001112 /LENGTH=408 /DNA_ID=CAMNT_0043917983 /DNA_START=166 /DNA_END=1392 /DNA_ORIENTATION=-
MRYGDEASGPPGCEAGLHTPGTDVGEDAERTMGQDHMLQWKNLFLLLVAFIVVEVQIFFVSMLFNLALRHFILPSTTMYRRSLYLDYTESNPVALVPMVKDKYLVSDQLVNLPPESSELIRQGFDFDVWLRFSLPFKDENLAIFQVQTELLALNQTVLFKSHRPCLVKNLSSPLKYIKQLAFAPLYIAGVLKEEGELYFSAVSKFRQTAEAAVSHLRVTILRRNDQEPPEFYSAEAHILMKLNMLQHFLYHYPLASFAVVTTLIATVLHMFVFTFLGLVVIYMLFRGSEIAEGEEEEEDKDSGDNLDDGYPSDDKRSDVSEDLVVNLDGDTERSNLADVEDAEDRSAGGKGMAEAASCSDADSSEVAGSWESSPRVEVAGNLDGRSTDEAVLKATSSKSFITETRQRK